VSNKFYAFGEILWDCLPSGRHAGGAPFNVCAHLAQLGCRASLISAVGQDALGDEIMGVARKKRVDTRFISRVRPGLPTGTTEATIDAEGDATYELVQPAAWDEITVSDEALAAVSGAAALTYGSLAASSPHNFLQLKRLLSVSGPVKFFDVNLRPPFADMRLVLDLARCADVIKLNTDELGFFASWLRTGEAAPGTPRRIEQITHTCAEVATATGVRRICVTLAEEGAALWDGECLTTAPSPRVEVKDTVGAGDAFMAGLMVGLTSGRPTQKVLENACQLGAYVASHHGATPLLPSSLIARFT
jgi:fructokinase